MKKFVLLFSVLFIILFVGAMYSQTVTQIILPLYIQGLNGTNNNRVPFVFRARIDGLLPSTTYRYINQVIISTDGPTTSGAGNVIFVNSDNSFVRTSGPSFSTAGNYGEFITNALGSFTGWFITETTGNARFVPGNYIFMRIRLNDGAGGTSAVTYLTLPDSIRIIDFGTANSQTLGTGIYGLSFAAPKDFVFLYDNEAGTGSPIIGTLVESDGIELSAVTSIALFYRDSIDNKNGRWGSIIPNILANGIRRIERRLLSDGSVHPVVATDPDGIWPSGANTVNPTGGLTPIKIESSDAPMPVELVAFSAVLHPNTVTLSWKTATELNNLGFDIERKKGNDIWMKIGFVNGSGNSNSPKDYSFTDKSATTGKFFYRLKQIDTDGKYDYSKEVEVDLGLPKTFTLGQNYPNPFNPATTITYTVPVESNVQLQVFTIEGVLVKSLLNERQNAGVYRIEFDASKLSSGTYFYKLWVNNFIQVKKMLLMK